MELLRKRVLTITTAVVLLAVIIGMALEGWDFLSTTIDVPDALVHILFWTNAFLAAGAMFGIKRSLLRFEDEWTWQEVNFSRGVFLICFASVLGYLSRAWDATGISLGTPLFTIGCLVLISAMVRPPERFTEEPNGSPR